MGTAVRDFLGLLATDDRFLERVVHIETTPPREARYGSLSRPLPEGLRAYCDGRGIRLYTHQCAAIEHLRAGENVIITTPTASGKTLAFLLPVFERLAADPAATALFLYPTKALANDQVKVVRELERISGLRVDAAIYDGDTPTRGGRRSGNVHGSSSQTRTSSTRSSPGTRSGAGFLRTSGSW